MFRAYIFLILTVTANYGNAGESQLLMVLALWRHGDRTPIHLIPTDTENTWPQGLGELTPRGMAMHYRLGQAIRKRYIETTDTEMKIIDKFYNSKQIYVRSTDVNRTLISALSNLAGFYPQGDYGDTIPPKGEVDWPAAWQPVPVHTVENKHDTLLNPDSYCPRKAELQAEIKKLPEYVNVTKQNQQFFDFLKNETGYAEVTLSDIGKVWGPLFIESQYPETHQWPKWVTESMFSKLTEIRYVSDRLRFDNPELARLGAGTLLGDILGHMQARIECVNKTSATCKEINERIYWVYSAHDSTEEAFFNVLGNYKGILGDNRPGYASCTLFELWSRKYGKWKDVKVLYKANDTGDFEAITRKIKGCPLESDFCPLTTFAKRSKDFIPVNYSEECKAKNYIPTTTTVETVTEEQNCPARKIWINLTIILAVTTAVFFLATLCLAYKFYDERKKHQETAYSMSFTALQNYKKSGAGYFNESIDKEDVD